MPSILLEYRLRIRDAANLTDALVISSIRGDTLPYLAEPPTCDGQELNPLTGEYRCGVYSGYIVDAITSGTSRVMTSQLEDATFRQQLMRRVALWEFRTNGGAWTVLGAGYLTLLRLVDGVRWSVTVSDATRLEDTALAFSPKKGALALSANALGGATSLSVSALPFAIPNGVVLYFLSGKQATVSASAAAGATSVSVTALAAGLSSGDTAAITEAFASYFARWPQRGCVFGGMVTKDPNDATSTGFLGVPDLGGWVVIPKEQTSLGGEDRTLGTTFFYPLTFYAPPSLKPTNNISPILGFGKATDTIKQAAGVANAAVESLVVSGGVYGYAPGFPSEFKSVWPGLVYQIAPASTGFTGASSEFFAPEGDDGFGGPAPYSGKYTNGIIDVSHGRPGPCVIGTAIAVSGTRYRIRALTCMPSEASPLYWTGHPIDLFKAMMDEQLRVYDSAACELVRQAIGADRRISLRITEQPKVNEILQNAVYAPFGIAVRVNTAGILEPITTRIFTNSPPTLTITAADIWSDEGGSTGIESWFELDESTAIRKVVFEYQNFYQIQDSPKFPPDGVGAQSIRIERTNGDPGAFGEGVATFTVPGMIHAKDSPLQTVPVDSAASVDAIVQSWVNQLVLEVFERWGRGIVSGELPLLRGAAGDSVKVGDEILNAIPQLPNKNKRLLDDGTVGARAMQVVRLTPSVRGAIVKLADSGPNAPAFATLPTATIAAAPSRLGLRFAQITVTNAATLNGLLAGVQVQVAVTTGATPAATDYTPAAAYGYGQIPTTAFRLSSIRAGRTVWARLRSTQYGSRPSAWTTPISVALTAFNPPTSVSVTPNVSDGSQALVAWTPGVNADLAAIDVYLRPSAQAASTAVRQAILGNGSLQYNLEGLTPNTSYTVGVQSRDLDTNDLSVMVEVTFTTANVTVTLATPLYPQGFVGSPDLTTGLSRMDGLYGLSVLAAVFPSNIEFWQAIETAPTSGTYGSFALVGTIPSVQGDWSTFTGLAPNDKLRRQLEARHTRDGATSSAFTAAVTVAPWGTAAPRPKLSPGTRIAGQGRSVVQMLTYEVPNAEYDIWESASQPHAWSVDTGDSSSCAQDQATVFSGDSSAKYSFGAGGSAGTFRGLTTNEVTAGAFCIPLHPGTKYRFKFVSRVSSIANAPSYRVTLTHDVGGTLVTTQTYAYRAANKFQIDLLTFMVPLGAGPLTKLAIEYTRNSTTATDFWQDGTRLQDIGTQRCVILTSGTSWTVPGDFNAANNTVELWGGGGGGAPGTTNANGGGGGGGGGYRYQKNFDPSGATTVAYAIGGGGGASTAGGDTTWNAAAVTAKGGSGASVATSGLGGAIGSGGTGGVVGGNGGTGRSGTGNSGGGGGGGTAGSAGANNGASGSNVAAGAGGQGGTGVQSNASAVGGTGGVATGGAGGNASQLTSTDDATTAGAGGGGGGAFNPTSGGNGGQYGAGGGGGGATSAVAGSGSSGKQGVIVVSWITAT